jgi:hypothetical protein
VPYWLVAVGDWFVELGHWVGSIPDGVLGAVIGVIATQLVTSVNTYRRRRDEYRASSAQRSVGSSRRPTNHQACLGHGRGHSHLGLRDTVCGSPLNTHCGAFDGPATVRISTRRS